MFFHPFFQTIRCNPTQVSIRFSQKRSIRQSVTNFQTDVHNVPRRRVVITGVGVVSPVGCNIKSAWNSILKGYCGIKTLSDPSFKTLPCKIAARIDEQDVKLQEHFSKTELRSLAPAAAYALIAGNYRNSACKTV